MKKTDPFPNEAGQNSSMIRSNGHEGATDRDAQCECQQCCLTLEQCLCFENALSEISTRFVNLPADQIDSEIEAAQRQICTCLGIELSALWQWTENPSPFMTITHLHSPPDGPDQPEEINAAEAFPWALKQAQKGEPLIMVTEKLPSEAAIDQESRRHFGVKSSVAIPLSVGGKPMLGILSFDSLKEEICWPESIVRNLSLVAQIFANALDRKLEDQQLRESAERLNLATSAAEVGLWSMDIGSQKVWATRQARDIFNFKEDEPLNFNSFMQVIAFDDKARLEHEIQRSIQTGERLDIEYRILLPDEEVHWVHSSGKMSTLHNGDAGRLMGVSVDITERKKMEEQLRQQLDEINSLKTQLEDENTYLRNEIELKAAHGEIVGRSDSMLKVLAQVEQVAETDATVLIEGETGSGKELLARAVHHLSSRSKKPLLTVNCASLPPTLIESELFGREKGAYTGALTQMTGRFEAANGATLFLDEIGELPLEIQAKLLRVLEQGQFERLGSTQTRTVDVRIIAATNLSLENQVASGKFRKDLFYRLNVFPVHIPPLRERLDDIPPLVWTFVRQFENKMNKQIDHISRQCMNNLQHYAWPGNIRELKNVIERAMIESNGRTLDVHLPYGAATEVPREMNLDEAQRLHITDVLQKAGWRLSGQGGAAEILGMKRTTLQSTMKRLGIQRPTH